MQTVVKLYLEKNLQKSSTKYGLTYRVRCKYFLNGEETFDQILVPSTTENEGSFIIEELSKGKSLGDIHDMLHNVS